MTAKWSPLSDHTLLTLTRSNATGRARNHTCSPGAFWAVSAPAREELRRDLDRVATALGVPPILGATPTVTQEPLDAPHLAPAHDLTLDLHSHPCNHTPSHPAQSCPNHPNDDNSEADFCWNPPCSQHSAGPTSRPPLTPGGDALVPKPQQ